MTYLHRSLNSPSELLETAIAAADAAAGVHSAWEGQVLAEHVTEKGTSDFVSRVDLEAQAAALTAIRERFPEHEILPEEDELGRSAWGLLSSTGDASDRPLWIVDPLDGTTNYLHRHPAYAASVGVVVDGEAVAGAVVAAATGERWWGAKGMGAFRNGREIHVSHLRELRLALVGTGFPFKYLSELPTYLREVESVLPHCAGIRRGGSAALDLCYLAQGSLDCFWETRLDPWDVAAGLAILREAGGVAQRIDGSPLDVARGGSVLAANSQELLDSLQRRLEAAKKALDKGTAPTG